MEYRRHVDRHIAAILDAQATNISHSTEDSALDVPGLLELGIQHEQQHQELILTDIKHLFSHNPLRPVYLERPFQESLVARPLSWHRYEGGVQRIGYKGEGFSFDNERPRHRVFVEPFELGTRPITNGEYVTFIEDCGYERPELWLSDGWYSVTQQQWSAPLYWQKVEDSWSVFTLSGLRALNLDDPVCHVSFYEADAFARWSGARLATEAEWESAASDLRISGNFVESGLLHPAPGASSEESPGQMFGDVWEWTSSSYSPYPGFRPPAGALGEYNGKFMCNQMVLRGGSCVTPQSHIRATYRNFFPPDARWQFSGIRLARDVEKS
jgi:ergothioneine biosynthesis protein EgtB